MALIVDTNQLNTVAINLKQKKEDILNLYNTKVKLILDTSEDAIIVSGLNFNEFETYFAKAFTDLANEIEILSSALQNQILPRYDNLSISIKNAFNKDFASQMQVILNELK